MRCLDGTRPPQNVEDFVKSLEREAPHIKKAIEERYYVILPKVRSGIIAYERDPDTNGLHGVVTTVEGPHDLTTQELVAKLKAQSN